MTKAEILEKLEELYSDGSTKLTDLYGSSKLAEIDALNKLLGIKKEEEKKASAAVWIFAILGVIVVVAIIAYLVYRYFEPDYLEDFEDDFEDEFDEDFFEDEDETVGEV